MIKTTFSQKSMNAQQNSYCYKYLCQPTTIKIQTSSSMSSNQTNPLFSKTAELLTNMLHSDTTFKNSQHLKKRALSLGILIQDKFNRQTSIFTLAQTILILINNIGASENERMLVNVKKEETVNVVNCLPNRNLVKILTTKNPPLKCPQGNLNIAVLIYRMFCSGTQVSKIVEKIAEVRSSFLEEQDIVLLNITLDHRIFHITNLGCAPNAFRCHCRQFKIKNTRKNVLNCHFCLQEFHPGCQSNSIFCNSCFLRFGLMSLKNQLDDPFNLNKEIETTFFGYLANEFPEEPNKELAESIFFQAVKFNLKKAQGIRKFHYVQIRLCVVNKVFPDELLLAVRRKTKPKCQPNQFWELDEIQYYMYLNHNEIKYSEAISKNCISLKVSYNFLEENENVLIIKTVRRNKKYNYKPDNVLTYWPQQQGLPKILMLGIFHIHKKKPNSRKKKLETVEEISPDTLRPITVYQSHHHLQYIEQQINQVPYQIVNLYNQSGSKKIQIPVRSFGCHHVQCFDYEEFKQSQKAKKEKTPRKWRKPRMRLKHMVQQVIQIQSSSSQVEVIEEDQFQEELLNKPQQARKSVGSKKIYKAQSAGNQKKEELDDQLLCPICHRKLLILYEDPLFKQIILNSGFYKNAKILNNGEYNFEGVPKIGQ